MANGCKWYVHWCVLSLANVYLSNVQISIADLETRGYIESVYIKNTHKCCWWLVCFHAYFRKAPNESLILFQAHFTAGFMHDTIRHTCPWHHVLIVAFLLLLAGHQAHRPPMWELTQLTFLFLCTGCDSQYNSTESIHQGLEARPGLWRPWCLQCAVWLAAIPKGVVLESKSFHHAIWTSIQTIYACHEISTPLPWDTTTRKVKLMCRTNTKTKVICCVQT